MEWQVIQGHALNIIRDTKMAWAGALGGLTLAQWNTILSMVVLGLTAALTIIKIIKEFRKDKEKS